MKTFVLRALGVDTLHSLACCLSSVFVGEERVALIGPLGAGKTEFVRGVASYFAIADDVSSPTFVLENVYFSEKSGKNYRLRHWDLYRLSPSANIEELFEHNPTESGSICLVEWADRIDNFEDMFSVIVKIDFSDDDGIGGSSDRRDVTMAFSCELMAERFSRYLQSNSLLLLSFTRMA